MTVSNNTFVLKILTDSDTDVHRTKHAGRYTQGLVDVPSCDDLKDSHADPHSQHSSLFTTPGNGE